jgi:hypothetical protein
VEHAALSAMGSQTSPLLACDPVQSGVKIITLLEEVDAEHSALGFAELWGLPLSEESLETVAREV